MAVEALSKEEVEVFFKLHKSLMYYVNKKKNIIKEWTDSEDVKGDLEKVHKLREFVLKDRNLIDSFIKENPFNFSSGQLQTIEKWKQGVRDKFFIIKYAQDQTYFYQPETKKCYVVYSLFEPLKEMMGPYLPIMVEAWLIPYKGKIIYDSLIVPYRISFGGNMRKSLKSEYEESIIKQGLISSFDDESEKKETSNEELLRFYMRSEANRNKYYSEIIDLKGKSPDLNNIYHQELGKSNSRWIKKQIKQTGINGFFAVLDNVIVASGSSKKVLLKNIEEILPEEKKEHIHIFKV